MAESAEIPVADLQRAGVIQVEDGNHGEYRPRPDEFGASGVPYIRATDIDAGRVRFDSASRINNKALARIRKGIGKPGDVILSHKGTVGKVAFAPFECERFVCSPQTTFWRVLDEARLDRRFLFYYLLSPAFRAKLLARENESDMAGYVSLSEQRRLLIPVPPLDVQHETADVLTALDNKIELNRRMNETLAQTVVALFGSRFAGVAADGTVADLAAVSRVCVDPQQSPDELFDHFSIPAFDDGRRPARERGVAIKSTKLKVPRNALLLSKLNPRIPRLWLPDVGGRQAICSTEFIVCVPRGWYHTAFLFGFFSSSRFRGHFASLVTGTSGSHQRVRVSDFLALPAPIPSEPDVEAYAGLARPLLARMLHNLRESETLAQLRDTLLPGLISGELRLREAEAAVEAEL